MSGKARNNQKATGVIPFKVGNRRFEARADFNAMVRLEDELGVGMLVLVDKWSAMQLTLGHVRGIIWAGLTTGKDDDLTVEEVGELCNAMGFTKAFEVAGEIILAAFPDQSDYEGVDEGDRNDIDPNAE